MYNKLQQQKLSFYANNMFKFSAASSRFENLFSDSDEDIAILKFINIIKNSIKTKEPEVNDYISSALTEMRYSYDDIMNKEDYKQYSNMSQFDFTTLELLIQNCLILDELMSHKSKELIIDIRVVVIKKITSYFEKHHREVTKHCHKQVTKILSSIGVE